MHLSRSDENPSLCQLFQLRLPVLVVVLAWPHGRVVTCTPVTGCQRMRSTAVLTVRDACVHFVSASGKGKVSSFPSLLGYCGQLIRSLSYALSFFGTRLWPCCIKFCTAVSARSNAFFSYLSPPPLSTFVPPSHGPQHAPPSLPPFPPSPNLIAGYDVYATVIK